MGLLAICRVNTQNLRTGGLAWLRYLLDMAGVEGSNPFRHVHRLAYLVKVFGFYSTNANKNKDSDNALNKPLLLVSNE